MRFILRPPVRCLKSFTRACTFSLVRLPGTTLTTSLCSASSATWSQWSPQAASSGLSGSQCFSFLPTKAHFSSNWISRVCGGKSHEFVVQILGVPASQQAVADDGILVHPDQATRLAYPTTFVDMGQQRDDLLLRQPGPKQRRAFPLG